MLFADKFGKIRLPKAPKTNTRPDGLPQTAQLSNKDVYSTSYNSYLERWRRLRDGYQVWKAALSKSGTMPADPKELDERVWQLKCAKKVQGKGTAAVEPFLCDIMSVMGDFRTATTLGREESVGVQAQQMPEEAVDSTTEAAELEIEEILFSEDAAFLEFHNLCMAELEAIDAMDRARTKFVHLWCCVIAAVVGAMIPMIMPEATRHGNPMHESLHRLERRQETLNVLEDLEREICDGRKRACASSCEDEPSSAATSNARKRSRGDNAAPSRKRSDKTT